VEIDKNIKETDAIDKLPVVFVLGPGKCGSLLLREILDWHDEVLVLPVSIKFYSFWQQIKDKGITTPQEIADLFLTETNLSMLKFNTVQNRDGIQEDYSNINWNIFEARFREYLNDHEICASNTCLGIFYAYACSSKKNLKKVKVIIVYATYKDHMEHITRDFPKAQFIYLMRDIRGNIFSLKSNFLTMRGSLVDLANGSKRKKSLFVHIIKDRMVDNLKIIHENERLVLNGKLKILRFEDIKLFPRKTIEQLCDWLGIKFNDSLLTLTKAGVPSSGGYSGFSNQLVIGFTEEPVSRWKSQMPKREIRMVEYLFSRDLSTNGYQLIYENKNSFSKIMNFVCCFLPWKGEIFYMGYRKSSSHNKTELFLKCYIKPFIILPANIIMFIISRIIFLRLLLKGEFKSALSG
jgi:hypothetical protein